MPELIESIESRSISSSSGQSTGTRVFHYSGVSSVKTVVGDILNGSTIGSEIMPKPNDTFPGLAGLRLVDYNVALVSDQTDLWRIEFTYQQNGETPQVDGGLIGDLNGKLSGEKGHIEIASEIRSEFVPAFRGGITFFPRDGIVTGLNVEVGGISIDAAGSPTSIQRDFGEITVSETMTFSDAETLSPIIADFRFARNFGTFLGNSAGRVLYRGASIRRVSESFVSVQHSFSVDRAFHLQQKVALDQDGEPFLNSNYQAAFVYYVQPFPRFRTFSKLSPSQGF